jgi:hypothetical protein
MHSRRLEDRIRSLSARLASATESEFPSLLAELRAVLSEHALRMENKASATVISWPQPPNERRNRRAAKQAS